jgi:serine protease Do
LQGGSTSATVDGQSVMVGGDVIVGVGRQTVTSMQDLQTILASARPSQRVTLRVLRDGQTASVTVTLGQAPTSGG